MIVVNARDAAEIFEPIFAGARIEKLAVAHLDSSGVLIALREAPAGIGDGIALPVRDILCEALELRSAALILAHNHPSGDPRPSEADIRATRTLDLAASAMGIALKDHLIFADGGCRSLRGLGLL